MVHLECLQSERRSGSELYALKDVLCLNVSQCLNAIREAETLHKISHENIIAIKGAGLVRRQSTQLAHVDFDRVLRGWKLK